MHEEQLLIQYLKESIDRLGDKFEQFLRIQNDRDIKQKELETILHVQDTRLVNLEMPNQKKLQEKYPIFYKVAETLVLVVITVIVMHFFPPAAKILTGIFG